jgi:hypothetical protein
VSARNRSIFEVELDMVAMLFLDPVDELIVVNDI